MHVWYSTNMIYFQYTMLKYHLISWDAMNPSKIRDESSAHDTAQVPPSLHDQHSQEPSDRVSSKYGCTMC